MGGKGSGGYRRGAGRPFGSKGEYERTKVLKAKVQADLEAKAERVLTELKRLSFSDLAECFDEQGRLKPLREMPEAIRVCISAVKVTKKNLVAGDGKQEDVVEVRLWDKVRALEMLAKHHNLLVERVEMSGSVSLGEKIAAARERLAKAKGGS